MTTRPAPRGFAIVELLVSIVILAVGILAVAGGSMYATRHMQRSQMSTRASSLATAKLEELVSYAYATEPECTSNQFASSTSAVATSNVSLTWNVPVSGSVRLVRVFASYKLSKGIAKIDTLTAKVPC